MKFRKATRKQRKLRLAIDGPTGAGKTWTALAIASGLGKSIGLIDTENSSSELYSKNFDFNVLCLSRHRPEDYVAAIAAAAEAGFDVLVIDSLSHAWAGREGALEQVDDAAARSKGNSFVAWREVTPQHNRMVDAIIHAPMHVIVTMRSKMAYELVDDGKGRKVPQKIGLQPIQRDGLAYEFDLVADMDLQHRFIVDKTRCSDFDREVIEKPGAEVGKRLAAWLNEGEAPAAPKPKSNGAGDDRDRIKRAIETCRAELGEERYFELIGDPEWKPKNMAEAKKHLEEMEALLRGDADNAPLWSQEANG